MKRILPTLILLALCFSNAFGAEEKTPTSNSSIKSFVNESKLWHCQIFKNWGYGGENFYFKGDTLINGILAKRMYAFNVWDDKEKYRAALYEESDKVYCCHADQNEFNLLYDFGVKKGEEVLIDGKSYTVEDVEEIIVKGGPLRVQHLSFTDANRTYQFIWVQGYGGEMTPLYSGPRLTGNYDNFVYCESDGEMLIESKDIPIPDKQGSSNPIINWVGSVWSYYEYHVEKFSFFRYTVLDRPEVIDGHTYYPLVKFTTCEYIEGEEVAVYRIRQERDKVYIRKEDFEKDTVFKVIDAIFKEKGNDYLFYDFSLNEGEKYCHLSYHTPISYPLIVHEVDTVQSANNVWLKKMNFRSEIGEDTWLAGIGSLYDLMEPFTHSVVDCPCSRTLNYFCTADSSIVYRNPRTNVFTGSYDNFYDKYNHFKEDDCALNPSNIGEVADASPFLIQANGERILCTSPTAVKLEVYTMDAIKVGEAAFANGEASVKVGKAPATYLYIVTYPNGRRESGKVAVK